jgi:hypothetical protein
MFKVLFAGRLGRHSIRFACPVAEVALSTLFTAKWKVRIVGTGGVAAILQFRNGCRFFLTIASRDLEHDAGIAHRHAKDRLRGYIKASAIVQNLAGFRSQNLS